MLCPTVLRWPSCPSDSVAPAGPQVRLLVRTGDPAGEVAALCARLGPTDLYVPEDPTHDAVTLLVCLPPSLNLRFPATCPHDR